MTGYQYNNPARALSMLQEAVRLLASTDALYRWKASGCLAEAETSLSAAHNDLAMDIRLERLALMEDAAYKPNLTTLVEPICDIIKKGGHR